MDPIKSFQREKRINNKRMGQDKKLKQYTRNWMQSANKYNYSYNFSWLGRPIIQYPQDIIAMQEIIWQVQPDLIIETGIAHGGSIIFSASMMELMGGDGKVVGIDIDIRQHNRIEIEKHPMFKRIIMIEGSSTDEGSVKQVRHIAENKKKVIVFLDSNHTYNHVLKELKLYSEVVTVNSYIVAFDTIIEEMPRNFVHDRPWGVGNNPKTAVQKFLRSNDNFIVDNNISSKLLITVAPGGFLKRIK